MADEASAGEETPEGAEGSLEGGNYEVIRNRLIAQGKALGQQIEALNARRKEVFGGTELEVIANERIRTENNCVPRDILNVQGQVLFGYNVFVGLKKETDVSDVFSLHKFAVNDGAYDFGEVDREAGDAFLADPAFVKEFQELYRYYDKTRLVQLRKTDTRLLALFQTGATIDEVKVFRWKVHPDGTLSYMDGRGDRDHVLPPPYDFEWTQTTRDHQVTGRFPHLSILDECFIETTGGDLTIKVENNTESGRGIYAEPVEDPNQTLDDGEFYYAKLGGLLLLKILPFREAKFRYLVFNAREQSVHRIDAVGEACRQLPEDHGIIFPGGYYLQTGEYKIFDAEREGLQMKRVIKSPNGEDVLYVFHRKDEGRYELLPYNLIRKEAQTPIQCHGFSIFDDGQMLVFRALSDEPTRVHPMQIWRTPFFSAEHAAAAPTDGSFLAKVGNAELVRGISDAYSIKRLIDREDPRRYTYDDLVESTNRILDAYYWLANDEVGLKPVLDEIKRTAELVIDEFEKVLAMQTRAREALEKAEAEQTELVRRVHTEELQSVDAYMGVLTALRHQRGHLITLRDIRYIDLDAIQKNEDEVVKHFDRVSRECVQFLLRDDALKPVIAELEGLLEKTDEVDRVADINPLIERLEKVSEGLNVISEVVAGLEVDDATARTRILEAISEVFSQLNRTRATLTAKRQELLGREGRAEFAAQFNLLGQSVSSGLTLADTPERTDEQLSRLMVQLEELEARFSDFDEFLEDIGKKREEIYDAFSSKKQALLDERQRRAENLMNAAHRILEGVGRRWRSFKEQDELNAYFASDPMVMKLRQIVEQLRELDDSVKAEEVEARLKTARQDSLRAMRDKLELFEEGEDLIKFGKHRFTVNTQPLELSLVPREGEMALHLTGTNFYELVEDADFRKTEPFWDQQYISETREVYRGEYLAASILFSAEAESQQLSVAALHEAERNDGGLLGLVRKVAADRYDEGYERGVHDADAALILEKILVLRDSAALLRYPPGPRTLGCLYWAHLSDGSLRAELHQRAYSLGRLTEAFGPTGERAAFGEELGTQIHAFFQERSVEASEEECLLAGRYLVDEIGEERPRFVTSHDAAKLRDLLLSHLDVAGTRRAFDDDRAGLGGNLGARIRLTRAWVEAFVRASDREEVQAVAHASEEAAGLLLTESLDRDLSEALTAIKVEGLLGQHPRISNRTMELRLDEFLERLGDFAHRRAPAFREYRNARHSLLEDNRERLRLEEYKPKVMSSFVRNRLINEVYLPMIGDNLAKQMGAAGAGKRTDLMGLLLLISPPGYGKTTLMEYIANRLGLVFMKVNGPSLGHGVHSLDPGEAPNATARQEVEKINLAFEMGNNVMLYLDDIQHTHPELLQKFISLCDAQRRVEGVWKGKTRTYDLRGKKFCVVMAGNPYTESGDKFQIPDMLANRADTYNLGDILEGKDQQFALSYIENSLTSNAALSPLATREQGDVYKVIKMAEGEQVATTDLSYGYSGAELSEMTAVFERLFKVRDVLLAVNLKYIESASQEDSFRTEPPFKLQGSYRNMNKLSEKVVSAMNDEELERLIDDHYASESQTLTTGAEQNLLKLAEMRGRMTDEQRARWEEIKAEFRRQKSMGGAEDDPVTRVTGTLSVLGQELSSIREALGKAVEDSARAQAEADKRRAEEQRLEAVRNAERREAARREAQEAHAAEPNGNGHSALVEALAPQLSRLEQALIALQHPKVEVHLDAPGLQGAAPNQDVSALVAQQFQVVERSLLPLVQRANQDLADSKALHEHVMQLLELIRRVDAKLRADNEL
ncbi:MAG: DNA repair ATPase [Myxococcota bacterium]